ncbi:MAG: sigma factor, partial [Gemmatimonadota bacterium]
MSEPAAATRVEDDRLLVERAQAGDERALDRLVARHHGAVYQAAYRVLGDPDRAADAAQDALVKALRAL